MPQLPNGQTRFTLWGGNSLTLSGSPFDIGSSTIFQFDAGVIKSFRSGRNPSFNSLSTLSQWYGYQVSAIGSAIDLPDNDTLGLGTGPVTSNTPIGTIAITTPTVGQTFTTASTIAVTGTYTLTGGVLTGIRARFNGGIWVEQANPSGGTYSINLSNNLAGSGNIEVEFVDNETVKAAVAIVVETAPLLQDSFTNTANTLLSAHTANTGQTYTKHSATASGYDVIVSSNNRLRISNATNSTGSAVRQYYYSSLATPSTAFYAEFDITVISNILYSAGVAFCMSSSAETLYAVDYSAHDTSAPSFRLLRTVAGTTTVLGSYTSTIATGNTATIRVEVQPGGNFNVFVNGTSRITATDTAIALGTGFIGFRFSLGASKTSSDTTGVRLDNLKIANFTPTPTVRAVFFGDSIVEGQNATTTANRWTSIVSNTLGYTEINEGIGGTVLEDVENAANNGRGRYVADIINNNPNKVYIQYGINDSHRTNPAYSLAGFQADLTAIVDGIIASGLAASNITIGTPTFYNSAYDTRAYTSSNTNYQGGTIDLTEAYGIICRNVAAAKGCYWVDTFNHMKNNGGNSLIDTDNIHPLNTGHQVISQAYLNNAVIPTAVTAPVQPLPPTSVSATSPSAGTLQVNAVLGGGTTPTSFEIERSTNGTTWTNRVATATLPYSYTGLTAGSYQVRVRTYVGLIPCNGWRTIASSVTVA